jgi:hypothetical protein
MDVHVLQVHRLDLVVDVSLVQTAERRVVRVLPAVATATAAAWLLADSVAASVLDALF